MVQRRTISGILSYAVQVFVIASIISGCAPYYKAGFDGRYDSSHIYADSIEKILEKVVRSVYRVQTSTTFKIGDELSTLMVAGIAFSLDKEHLLTAKHVTSIDKFQLQTPFGLMSFPIPPENKVKEETFIILDDGTRKPVTVIYRDPEIDFALLGAQNQVEPPSYPIGNSEDFGMLNAVILPSNFQTGLNIRLGYITQLDFVQYGAGGEVKTKNNDIFAISTVVSEGDSGSPILLLRDGRIELGGVVSFIYLPAPGLGYGIKINPIMERLRALGHLNVGLHSHEFN